jgi:hypothetical protein
VFVAESVSAVLLLQFCYKPYPAICFIKIEKPRSGFFPCGFQAFSLCLSFFKMPKNRPVFQTAGSNSL